MNEKTNLHLDDLRKCTQDFESAEDFHYPIIQNEYTNNLGVKTYTSGQIGKYFGVAISTISLWISEGRFFDIEKPGMGIKETTLWKGPNGKCILVKDVVKMWEQQYKEVTEEDEVEILKEELSFFEKKYGGFYENTIMLNKDKNDFEERDSAEWSYIIRRLNNV